MRTSTFALAGALLLGSWEIWILTYRTAEQGGASRADSCGVELMERGDPTTADRIPRAAAGDTAGGKALVTAPFVEGGGTGGPDGEAGRSSAPRPGDVEVLGLVTVIDGEQAEHRTESGSFRAVFYMAGEQRSSRVTVENGAWRLKAPLGGKFHIQDLELGGEPARVPELVSIREDATVELRAFWMHGITIRAIDAQTGTDLSGICLVRCEDWVGSGRRHPGSYDLAAVVVRDGESPLTLEGVATESTYWVGAAGYTWGRVAVAPGVPTDQIVTLEPSATLLIRASPPPSKGVFFRLYPTGPSGAGRTGFGRGIPAIEVRPDTSGTTVIEGITPGTYQLRAEVGEWYREPLCVGTAEVDLSAGDRTEVDIALDATALEATLVPLRGRIFVHESWETPDVHLRTRPIKSLKKTPQEDVSLPGARMRLVAARPLTLEWDAGEVVPGPYEAVISPFQLHVAFEMDPGGDVDRILEVPPAVTAFVRVIDAITNRSIPAASVTWHGRLPQGIHGSVLGNADFDPARKEFVLRCPSGPIRVSASAEGYGWADKAVDARPPTQAVVIELARAQGVRVRLSFQGRSVSIAGLRVHCHDVLQDDRPSRGNGGAYSKTEYAHVAYVNVAGRYRIMFSGTPVGYDPVPEREVEIPPDELVDLVVELTRP